MKPALPIFVLLACLPVMRAAPGDGPGKLEDYPVKDRVWLASAVGEVTVNPEYPVEISALGELKWLVKSGQRVEKDVAICLTAAKKIDLSARDLALTTSRYPNSRRDLDASNRDQVKALKTSLEEANLKLEELNLTATEEALVGENVLKALVKERETLREEVRLMEEKLQSDYFTRALADARTGLQLELDQARQGHDELLRGATVRAEIGGTLEILGNEVLQADSLVAKIIQSDLAEVRLEVTDPRLLNVPPEELAVQFSGDEGRVHEGRFSRVERTPAFTRQTRILIFTLEKNKDEEELPASLSGIRMLRIERILKERGHLVPKQDFLFQFPEEINEKGWAAFIENRWPEARLSYVGPTHLVVSKKP